MATELGTPKTEVEPSSAHGPQRAGSRKSRLGKVVQLLAFLLIIDIVAGEAFSQWREGTNALVALWSNYLWAIGATFVVGGVIIVLLIFVFAATQFFGPYVGTLVLAAFALWLWGGTYNWTRDVLIALLSFPLVFALGKRAFVTDIRRKWIEKKPEPGSFTDVATRYIGSAQGWTRCVLIAGLVTTWCLASLADATLGPAWSVAGKPAASLQRFAELDKKRTAAPQPDPSPRRLGVALSGGGFRAAVMHAGVLAALEELDLPIAGLATVSGGSIIGGYYVAGGPPEAFVEVVADGRFNLKRDLVDVQNLLLLACPGQIPFTNLKVLWFCSHSRVDAQADLLDRVLFHGKRLSDLAESSSNAEWTKNPPFWLIGATDLLTGDNVGISARGVFRRAQATPGQGPHRDELLRVPSDAQYEDASSEGKFVQRRVAEVVAFSGAFPGAFASTTFEVKGKRKLQIIDGGITDNLGYSLLVAAREKSAPQYSTCGKWQVDAIVVSDGGLPLSEKASVADYTGTSDFMRAMDVVYASAGIAVGKNDVEKVWLLPRAIQIDQIDEADFNRLPKALRNSRNLTVVADFKKDVALVRKTFPEISTLKDNFDPSFVERIVRNFQAEPKTLVGRDAVNALYALGQYLVYLNAPEITRVLSRAVKSAAAPC